MSTVFNVGFWVLAGSLCFVVLTGCENPNQVIEQRTSDKTESYRCINNDGTTSANVKYTDSICN